MSRNSAVTLAAKDGPWAQIRTGVVVDAAGSNVVVLVGAATFTASVVIPFGITDPSAAVPSIGSLVAVGRQDASWTVFGTILGASGNLIQNGSFDESPTGAPPEGWTLYNVENTSIATVIMSSAPVVGSQVVLIDGLDLPANCRSILYSTPVSVRIGDRLQLSAFAGGQYSETAPPNGDAGLLALWFATDTDVYPTVSSPDTLVTAVVNVPQAPPWTPMSGTVTAPVNGYMRLGLNTALYESGQNMMYDFATVRRFD